MNKTDLFTYSAVDINGRYQNIDLANFTIIDLGTEWAGKYTNEGKIQVKEKSTSIIRPFHSLGHDKHFLQFDLMKLVRQLSNAGSFATLDVYDRLEVLEVESQSLRDDNARLKSLVKGLEEQLQAVNS